MSARLRIALALQLLFFAGWGARLLGSHQGAGFVWLATEPVDPRDLLSGHYVALRYPIASVASSYCDLPEDERGGAMVWIELAPTGPAFETSAGTVTVSEAVGCATSPPAAGVWIAGRLDAGGRIAYGIERMFVSEDDPRREARSGTVVAKVALNESFEPRLVDLVRKEHGNP